MTLPSALEAIAILDQNQDSRYDDELVDALLSRPRLLRGRVCFLKCSVADLIFMDRNSFPQGCLSVLLGWFLVSSAGFIRADLQHEGNVRFITITVPPSFYSPCLFSPS